MFSRLQKYVLTIIALMPIAIAELRAQVINLGGVNDGFAKSSYIEPDPATDIYFGGINDGFAVSSYLEPDPANDIYRGGINDGFALNAYIEADPANDIYDGGVNDGFAFNSYLEPNPAGDIYSGGVDDGFAKNFFSEELALPVQWKYFTIRKSNGNPILEWGTDREEKCSRYEILRSHDGKIFESISTLECKGNSLNNEYEFEDASPLWHRVYYYKIAQYDIDSDFIYSVVKAFNSEEPSKPEIFYKDRELIVKTERESKPRSVNVFDFTGRTLCSGIAEEQDGYYSINCQLAPHQLVIVHVTFDSFIVTSHMRIGN